MRWRFVAAVLASAFFTVVVIVAADTFFGIANDPVLLRNYLSSTRYFVGAAALVISLAISLFVASRK